MSPVGVLALQGDFREHRQALEGLGMQVVEVRLPEHLRGLQGLIIPGGESTTIGKLMVEWELLRPIRDFYREGGAIWGTCAGAIVLAQHIKERGKVMDQPRLGLMDSTVERNAFGRQQESFEADLDITGLEHPFHAVFIRAPVIEQVGPGVQALARVDGEIVMAQQGRLLATSFHPELTGDTRVHRLFLELAGVEDLSEAWRSPSPYG